MDTTDICTYNYRQLAAHTFDYWKQIFSVSNYQMYNT